MRDGVSQGSDTVDRDQQSGEVNQVFRNFWKWFTGLYPTTAVAVPALAFDSIRLDICSTARHKTATGDMRHLDSKHG